MNSRLDSLQAAALRVKLRALDEWNDRRRAIAARYMERLRDVDGLVLPEVPEWAEPVWHLFVVRHASRDALQSELSEAGVDSIIHYPIPPHLTGAYAAEFEDTRLPVAERLAAEVLSLPIGPQLPAAGADRVADAVRDAVGALERSAVR
jgi:dTDP-4-amino-4,6-dideoxygalactose transaminase